MLRGTLTKVSWSNPHGWIDLDVTGPDRKVVAWRVETNAPNAMFRRGWRKSDLVPGTAVVVEGLLARDGRPAVHATRITLADGRVLFSDEPTDGNYGLRRRR